MFVLKNIFPPARKLAQCSALDNPAALCARNEQNATADPA
jgi:hypothetical protein